ncbi:hypothetical protein I6F35_06435 [Bradyrhizobium sp. BRP22]|uniref:hypothetical protein n=1 Tax=Bradyrhizobium sp. BRP22 TaxID=2793821 RepID=UPI001CD5E4F9|nr:hypothetical protein [Bradyrhizobium sp. BRP22]MCA1452858.1 hypothetical protein [Bradyrhizobium sp. BRP22]
MKFITLNMVEAGRPQYNEDTGREEVTETSKPVMINAANIRCFYARRDGRAGTRITFSDGGGFAVAEAPDQIAQMVASGDTAARLALAPPATDSAN